LAVKSKKFAQNSHSGKIYGLRKSGRNVEGRRFFLCQSVLHIHSPGSLWKTLVDKLVDNVENFELSTGISVSLPVGNPPPKNA